MKKRVLYFSLIINLITIGYLVKKKLNSLNKPNAAELRRASKTDVYKIGERTQEDIIFIGDSQVERCQWHELFENCKLKNRGIGGDNLNGLISRIKNEIDSPPKKIFIQIGINDIIGKKTSKYILEKYKILIETINKKASNTEIYIISILPANNLIWPYELINNKQIPELNAQLSRLDSIVFIDLYSKITDKKGDLEKEFTTDGLHLNHKGYQLLKTLILENKFI